MKTIQSLLNDIDGDWRTSTAEEYLDVTNPATIVFFGTLHAQGKPAVEFFTETKAVIERWPKEWSGKS